MCARFTPAAIMNFYPRPPRGGRLTIPMTGSAPIDFYPRPPRGGRPDAKDRTAEAGRISIHALREEGDRNRAVDVFASFLFLSTPSARRATTWGKPMPLDRAISIHALREEGDIIPSGINPRAARFLSTPSARRATSSDTDGCRHLRNFYPRPPRGGRPFQCSQSSRLGTFLSTPSARRATSSRKKWQRPEMISIHALREEGDNKHTVEETKTQ